MQSHPIWLPVRPALHYRFELLGFSFFFYRVFGMNYCVHRRIVSGCIRVGMGIFLCSLSKAYSGWEHPLLEPRNNEPLFLNFIFVPSAVLHRPFR